MTSALSNRLKEVQTYFVHGDLHLGYRRLLDAAIETNNFQIYEQTLNFCDWYDTIDLSNGGDATLITSKVQELLLIIENAAPLAVPKAIYPKLKATNISKRYTKGNFCLSQIDLELYPRQIIGLVGENGNGKTTLLRLLNGELRVNSGKIDYHFSETPHPSAYDIRSLIAFIPQRTAPWYGSLMDNLQYASTYSGLKGRENYLWTEMIIARMGLRPYRSFSWSRISSGYKMRFELARALMKKPEMLLLDEPLANLDILAQQIILEDLKYLAQSESMPLSIILSSQQLYEVEKVSDQVIFLQKGIAKYQQTGKAEDKRAIPLVIELETTVSREVLQRLLDPCGLQKLSFNGGVYLLYFKPGTSTAQLLTLLGNAALPVNYLRDISLSSRRFFDA